MKGLATYKEYANILNNRLLNSTLSDEDKKEETDNDDEDNSESSDTMAFDAVINLKNTSLHAVADNIRDEDLLYSDEEVPYKELKEKYNLM